MTTDRPNDNQAADRDRQSPLAPHEEALLAVLDGADPFTEGGAPNADGADLETLGALATLLDDDLSGAQLEAGKAALFSRLALGTSFESPHESQAEVLPFKSAEPSPRMPSWVPLALAATVLLAVGLGAWSGFLFSEVRQMRTLVAGLESELDARALGDNQDEFQKVLFENSRLREQIGVATKPKTRVCALSPVDGTQPEATATVFLRPEDHEWSIATNNLAKCPLGRRYRVWFLNEQGEAVGSERLDHIDGETQFETAAGRLPDGVASILVTLEYPDKNVDQPSDARVLFGNRAVEIY